LVERDKGCRFDNHGESIPQEIFYGFSGARAKETVKITATQDDALTATATLNVG
jgi:hypothetical protein